MDILMTRELARTHQANGVPALALRGVNLAVSEGEFVAVMGPGGSHTSYDG